MLNLRLNYPSIKQEMDVYQHYVQELPDPQKYDLLTPPALQPTPEAAAVIARWLRMAPGAWFDVSAIIAVPSANSGLFCVLSGFQSVTAEIAVEQFTFPGFKQCAANFGYRLQAITCDDEGITPDSLRAYLQQGTCKLVYVQPTVHNPTCSVMSLERRNEIAAVIRAFPDVYLLEDDAYRFLHPAPPPSFLQIVPERTIHVYSLSKPFNPLLKSGYIIHPKDILNNLENIIRLTTSSASSVSVSFGLSLMAGDALRHIIREKQVVGLHWYKTVAEIFYDLDYKMFPGGFHIWLHTGTITGHALSEYMETQDISIPDGADFSVEGEPYYVRIALGTEWSSEKILPALEKIASVVRAGRIPE